MTVRHRGNAAIVHTALRRLVAAAACSLLALAAGGVAPASAQAPIERNPPAAAPAGGGTIRVGEQDYGRSDEAPLGVNLAGARLIGPDEAVPAVPGRGISVGAVPDMPPAAAVDAALAPFIGQPLSLGAIARMQAAVARVWREAGYPFVSVTVPPQEITSGVLVLRVIEFRAGTVTVEGGADRRRERVAAGVRLRPGERIDAARLGEDMDWINRNPYRRVEAVFAPGGGAGTSDLTLEVTEQQPFNAYAAWSNTGGNATGRDRWSIGAGAWIPALNDLTLAWRFTRGGDVWQTGNLFSVMPGTAGYASHSGRIDLPTWPRQALTIAPNYVATGEFNPATGFAFVNRTVEVPITYRTALSGIFPSVTGGDVYLGVEPKWLRRGTWFGGAEVAAGSASLVNLVAGWARSRPDRFGRTDVDIRLKTNAAGFFGGADAMWNTFTGGRVTSAAYVHLGADVTRATSLPAGFSWISQASALAAGQALPDTERLSLGGFHAVRGYAADERGADAGLVWRNELRLPTFSPLGAAGVADRFSPFLFVDLGVGYDFSAAQSFTLAGAGAGFDYAIRRNLEASLAAAFALANGTTANAGGFTLNASVKAGY